VRARILGAVAGRDWRTAWNGSGGYLERGLYALALLLGAAGSWLYAVLGLRIDLEDYAQYSRQAYGWFFRIQILVATFVAVLSFARSMTREKERDSLDLLILSPLTGFEILLGKSLGVLARMGAVFAAGLPVLLFMLPLGGMTLGEVVSAQVLLAGHLAAAGGVCALLAPWFSRPFSLVSVAWALVYGVLAAPYAAAPAGALLKREFGFTLIADRVAPVLGVFLESFNPLVALNREMAGVSTDLGASLVLGGKGLLTLLLCCLLGGILLTELHVRRMGRPVREGFWRALQRRARRASSSRWLRAVFFPLVPGRHPLTRRECSLERDAGFRMALLLFVAGFAAWIAFLHLGRGVHWNRDESRLFLFVAGAGAAVAVVLAVVRGAVSISADKRDGTFEAFLAANVEPEDIVRSRLAGLLLRLLYLGAAPLAYGVLVVAFKGPSAETWGQLGLGLVGLAFGVVTAALLTVSFSLLCRNATWAVVMSVLLGLPCALLFGMTTGGSLLAIALIDPVVLVLLTGLYVLTVNRFRYHALKN